MEKFRLFAAALAVACLLLILGTTISSAQVTFASLTGLVTDPGGAVIPGATVTLTNTDTGEERVSSTGATGRYTMSQLKPGNYELVIENAGFKRFVRSDIRLQGAQDAEINASLELGAVTEIVEVTGQAVMLDTQSANQTSNLNSQEITELPVNFRNPLQLVHANAGVTSAFQNSGRRSVSDRTSEQDHALFAMNGGREASNTITIDGVSNKGGAGDWGANFGTPSVDAVQEMQISRNTYDAQYGRVGNGVVSIVTKGGSDQYHGTLFWFHRNDNLDANQWERNRAGTARPEFKRQQAGLNVSGPLWKQKKIYAMFGFEATRIPQSQSVTLTVPTELERQGDFTQSFNPDGSLQAIYDPFTTRPNPDGDGFVRDPFLGNVIPASRFDSVGRQVAGLFPAPNQPGVAVTNDNNFFGTAPTTQTNDRWDGRLDWAPSQKYSMFFRTTRTLLGGAVPRFFNNGADTGTENDVPYYSVSWNNTIVPSPTWVINFNLGSGGGHRFATVIPNADGSRLTDLGYSEEYASQFENQDLGAYNVADYTSVGATRNFANVRRTHSGGVNVSNERGNHSIKFGYNIEFQRQNFFDRRTQQMSFNRGPTTGPITVGTSSVVGNSMASLLLGVGGGSARLSADPAKQNVYMGWYGQDTWRVTPALTLVLGVRYELQYGRTERYNRQGYFDYGATNPLSDQVDFGLNGGFRFSGENDRNLTALDKSNWAPRFGLSYKITDKLVMRSGYGISYSQAIVDGGITGMPGFDVTTPWVTNPSGEVPIFLLSNPFPNGLEQPRGSADGLLTQVGLNVSAWRHENPSPYLQSYSLDFQYELGRSMMVEIGYTGNQGRKYAWGQPRRFNQVPMSFLSEGQALNNRVPNPFFGVIESGPLSGSTVPQHRLLRLYPHFANVNSPRSEKGATSRFDALYFKFTRRFTDGLTILTSYQWSKAQDNASEDQGWFISDGLRDQFDPMADYSVSSHDVPHDFVTNLIWELPVGRDKALGGSNMPRALDAIIGGWQVSGIIRFSSGVPINIFAPNTLGAFGYAVKRTNVPDESAARLDNPTPERWFNTDAFVEPGQFEQGTAPRYFGALRNDGVANADISLSKYFDFTERIRAQLRGEFFNITNTPVFGLPTAGGQVTLGSGAFGTVTQTFRPPRQVQVGLKLMF